MSEQISRNETILAWAVVASLVLGDIVIALNPPTHWPTSPPLVTEPIAILKGNPDSWAVTEHKLHKLAPDSWALTDLHKLANDPDLPPESKQRIIDALRRLVVP